MNTATLLSLIQSPALLDNNSKSELADILNKYPYFQTVHLLFSKNLQLVNDSQFQKQVALSTLFVSDRKLFVSFLRENFIKPEQVTSTEIKQPEVKDDKKTNIKTQPVPEKTQIKPEEKKPEKKEEKNDEKKQPKVEEKKAEIKEEKTQIIEQIPEKKVEIKEEKVLISEKKVEIKEEKTQIVEQKIPDKKVEVKEEKTQIIEQKAVEKKEEKVEEKTVIKQPEQTEIKKTAETLEKSKKLHESIINDFIKPYAETKYKIKSPQTEKNENITSDIFKKIAELKEKTVDLEKNRAEAKVESLRKQQEEKTQLKTANVISENKQKEEVQQEIKIEEKKELKVEVETKKETVEEIQTPKIEIAKEITVIEKKEERIIPDTKSEKAEEKKENAAEQLLKRLEEKKLKSRHEREQLIQKSQKDEVKQTDTLKTEPEKTIVVENKVEDKKDESEIQNQIEPDFSVNKLPPDEISETKNQVVETENKVIQNEIVPKIEQAEVSTEKNEEKSQPEIEEKKDEIKNAPVAEEKNIEVKETKKSVAELLLEKIANKQRSLTQKVEEVVQTVKQEQDEKKKESTKIEEKIEVAADITNKAVSDKSESEQPIEFDLKDDEFNKQKREEVKKKDVEENIQIKEEVVDDKQLSAADKLMQRIAQRKNKVQSPLEIVNENIDENKKTDIIDRFIEKLPTIERIKEAKNKGDISEGSSEFNDAFMTETMAEILIKQGNFLKAKEVFEKLNLKFPEKNSYFAIRIQEIEKLINKQ